MAASVCAFILTLYALCGSAAGSGVLSAPTNVSLTSRNMDLVLRWDPPEGAAGDLNYTAEYRSSATAYKTGCKNISALQCDFTSSLLSVFGIYMGRVRVHRGAQSSDWVESKRMFMDREASIGPPSVTLHPIGKSLEVSITDPVFKLSSLREVYSSATYSITYWKSGEEEEVKDCSGLRQNRVVLDNLDPVSEYCVRVQIFTNQINTSASELSDAVCESTADKDPVPWVPAVVTVVVMAVLVGLVVVMVIYWKQISQFLCPEVVLPPHFKESLLPPPNSSMYLPSPPSEEVCDRVSIIADDGSKMEDAERPLEEGGSSRRHVTQEGS